MNFHSNKRLYAFIAFYRAIKAYSNKENEEKMSFYFSSSLKLLAINYEA